MDKKPVSCTFCNDTGVDMRETDSDDEITGCACDCAAGQTLLDELAEQSEREFINQCPK